MSVCSRFSLRLRPLWSTTPPVGGLLLAAIGLKALSDAAEISRDAREHDSDRR